MSVSGFRPTSDGPRQTGHLAVSGGHALYWQDWGPRDGVAALVLHGGPGSGFSEAQRRYFNPAIYRVVSFDQRGCGRSTPRGETRANTTGLLIDDIEALRQHLGVQRWLVVGGSWGATLALAYAARHRTVVSGALLRGLFVPSRAELDWFFCGAGSEHPTAWRRLISIVPTAHRNDVLGWLAGVFTGSDLALQQRATQTWADWENALSGATSVSAPTGEALQLAIDRYRVQAHYLLQHCWLDEADLYEACAGAQGLPVQFLHGREDAVCRPAAAWKAHEALAGSRFQWVDGAGHNPFHPAMVSAMEGALKVFARQGHFDVQGESI